MPDPPLPNIIILDLETLLDGYAYLLSNDSRTTNIDWILGDVGMGRPTEVPFGYISILTETVQWYTAGGGSGGLAAGGPRGLDDWQIPIILTVAFEPHQFLEPIQANPPANSPFNMVNNQGFTPPYKEQPGWRNSIQITQNIKKVLRTDVTVGGVATDTRIVESRYVIQMINEELYRCSRMTIQTQQRRIRGN